MEVKVSKALGYVLIIFVALMLSSFAVFSLISTDITFGLIVLAIDILFVLGLLISIQLSPVSLSLDSGNLTLKYSNPRRNICISLSDVTELNLETFRLKGDYYYLIANMKGQSKVKLNITGIANNADYQLRQLLKMILNDQNNIHIGKELEDYIKSPKISF